MQPNKMSVWVVNGGTFFWGLVRYDGEIVARLPRVHRTELAADKAASKLADFLAPMFEQGAISKPPMWSDTAAGDEHRKQHAAWCRDADALGKALERAQGRERQWRYRARLAGTGGDVAFSDFAEKARACGWVCPGCGQRALLTCDHIVPLKKGGRNIPTNIQPLCGACNSRKGQRFYLPCQLRTGAACEVPQ